MKIIHSSGKVAAVVQGFTNPRLQVLQEMSILWDLGLELPVCQHSDTYVFVIA
jgi:hypothetical protein